MGKLYEAVVGAIHIEIAQAYAMHQPHTMPPLSGGSHKMQQVGWYRCVDVADHLDGGVVENSPEIVLAEPGEPAPAGDGWEPLIVVEQHEQIVERVCGGPTPTECCDELGDRLHTIMQRRLNDTQLTQLLYDTPEAFDWDDGEGTTPIETVYAAFRENVYDRLFSNGLYLPGDVVTRRWRGVVIVVDEPTVDKREITAVTWPSDKELPIYRYERHNETGSQLIGMITKLWRDGRQVWAEGMIGSTTGDGESLRPWSTEIETLRPCADLTASKVDMVDNDSVSMKITGEIRCVVFGTNPAWPELPFEWLS